MAKQPRMTALSQSTQVSLPESQVQVARLGSWRDKAFASAVPLCKTDGVFAILRELIGEGPDRDRVR